MPNLKEYSGDLGIKEKKEIFGLADEEEEGGGARAVKAINLILIDGALLYHRHLSLR